MLTRRMAIRLTESEMLALSDERAEYGPCSRLRCPGTTYWRRSRHHFYTLCYECGAEVILASRAPAAPAQRPTKRRWFV